MPAHVQLCLALLVPSIALLYAAVYLDVRRGHARFLKLAETRDNVKSKGGSYRDDTDLR